MATQARSLADALGGKAYAVVAGAGSAELAAKLRAYPLDAIYVADDPDVDRYLLDPAVDYLYAAAQAAGPSLVLIPNTLSGRDVAGRLMARLQAGLVADVLEIRKEGDALVCVSPKLGGALITNCALRPAEYGIATVRPSAFAAAQGGSGAEIVTLEKPSRSLRCRDRPGRRRRRGRARARGGAGRDRGRSRAGWPGAVRHAAEAAGQRAGRRRRRVARGRRCGLGPV